MAGELQPALVRRHDRRAQHFAADVGVGLEPGDAFIGPVVHDAARFLGRSDLRHRPGPAGPGEIGAGEMQPRPGRLATIDRPLHVDLVVRRGAAGGARRGHAVGEVQPRRGELELHAAAARGVERVVVHPDDAGNHGVAGEVHDPRPRRRGRRRGRSNRHDLSAVDQDRLILERRLAGAVDDAHVLQGDARFRNADHRLDGRRERAHALRANDNRNRNGGEHDGNFLSWAISYFLRSLLSHLEHHAHAGFDVFGDMAVQHPLARVR